MHGYESGYHGRRLGLTRKPPAVTDPEKNGKAFKHDPVNGLHSSFIKFGSNCFSSCHTHGKTVPGTADARTMLLSLLQQPFHIR